MRSRPALAPPVAAPEPQPSAVPPVTTAQGPLRPDTAIRGEKSTPVSTFAGDPLFGMAVATVVLLAFLAALMA